MLRTFCAAAALLSLLIACAPLAQAQDYAVSTRQLSLVDQTCIRVMGLKPGEAWFAACRESLLHTFQDASATGPVTIAASDTARNFYEVSPAQRWEREQDACAQLGLHPGSVALHQCAAGLEGAFLIKQN